MNKKWLNLSTGLANVGVCQTPIQILNLMAKGNIKIRAKEGQSSKTF